MASAGLEREHFVAVDHDGLFMPSEPALHADPYPTYAALRGLGSIVWSPALAGWLLTRYACVEGYLKDRRFSAGLSKIDSMFSGITASERMELAPFREMLTRWALYSDGAPHARLRCSFARAFMPGVISPLGASIRAVTTELIDHARTRANGDFDLIRDLAVPLPVRVIGALLGVPEKDGELLKKWSVDLGLFIGQPLRTFAISRAAQESALAMAAYFRPLVEDRREHPTGDLLSMLTYGRTGSTGGLSTDEVLANAVLLLVAGHETTTNLIGNGVLALLRTPGAWSRCVAGDVDLERVVEELLRYDSPVQFGMRVATENIEFAGQSVRAGDRVYGLIGSANRDPLAFPDPERLDIARAGAKSLSFGHGAHFCPGAALARLEGKIAIEELARRCPNLAIKRDAPLAWRPTLLPRGLQSLPVTAKSPSGILRHVR